MATTVTVTDLHPAFSLSQVDDRARELRLEAKRRRERMEQAKREQEEAERLEQERVLRERAVRSQCFSKTHSSVTVAHHCHHHWRHHYHHHLS